MPLLGHENVRHATLLYRAKGVTVRTSGAGVRVKESDKCQKAKGPKA